MHVCNSKESFSNEARKANLHVHKRILNWRTFINRGAEKRPRIRSCTYTCTYLEEELEHVQQRSLKILGLKKDALPTLKERREKATTNELKRIQDDPSNPCNRFLSSAIESKYDLRRKNESIPKLLSKPDRHKMSFIPRACFNVPVSK